MTIQYRLSGPLNRMITGRPNEAAIIQYLSEVAATLEKKVALPEWRKISEVVWVSDETGVYVERTDHLPVLLVTGKCGSCSLQHLDRAIVYEYHSFDEAKPVEPQPEPEPVPSEVAT